MASFDVNFVANTSGDHYVAYATYDTYAAPFYIYTIVTVVVPAPGPFSVTIDIKENLYCTDLGAGLGSPAMVSNGVRYVGFTVAECDLLDAPYLLANGKANATPGPLQDDTNSDHIPDVAPQWIVDVEQQLDPCILTQIECSYVTVASVTVDVAGVFGAPPVLTIDDSDVLPNPANKATAVASLGDGIVTGVAIDSAGSGYKDGSYLAVPAVLVGQTAPIGVGLLLDITIGGGIVTSIDNIDTAGSGYTTADDGTGITLDEDNIPDIGADAGALTGTLGATVGTFYVTATDVPVTGGTGTGMTVDIIADGPGNITAATINNGGKNYTAADVVTIVQGGGASDDELYTIDSIRTIVEADLSLTCTGSFADEVDSIAVTFPGDGYTGVPAISGLAGGGGAATVVLAPCQALDLTGYECAGINNIAGTLPRHVLALLETVTMCADDGTLVALPAMFTDTPVSAAGTSEGNCHCQECKDVEVTSTGTLGTGTLTYQTCWSGTHPSNDPTIANTITMVSQTMPAASVFSLGCIMEGTLNIDNGDIDGVITVTGSVVCP